MDLRFPILSALILSVCLFAACQKDDPDPPDVPAPENGLPCLHIYTKDGKSIKSKTEWLYGTRIYLYPASGGSLQNLGTAGIKGRGNASWGPSKKPYAIDLDKRARLLGMPEGRRFDLLANFYDATDMRNAVGFEVARRAKGLEWTPHCEFVELYLNGKFRGNYLLTEHIEIDKTKLNLSEGGYLLELDKYYDEQYKFYSDLLCLPVMIKDYNGEMDQNTFTRIQDSFNYLETLLYIPERTTDGWQDRIDMDSFIDWWLVNELVHNGEPNHPKSSFMYREPGGKLKAGPIWDLDWNTLQGESSAGYFRITSCIWYSYFFQDPSFVKRLKEKWEENKADYKDIPNYIDELADYIRQSVAADRKLWPMGTNVNHDESLSFSDAVSRMKAGYAKRFEWIDRQISAM